MVNLAHYGSRRISSKAQLQWVCCNARIECHAFAGDLATIRFASELADNPGTEIPTPDPIFRHPLRVVGACSNQPACKSEISNATRKIYTTQTWTEVRRENPYKGTPA
jgi:hypothetical protein